MEEKKQQCPVCNKQVNANPRYPNYVCADDVLKATDSNGNPVKMGNISMSGGFGAEYGDGSQATEVVQNREVYIGGIKFDADEAYFGGIVVTPKPAEYFDLHCRAKKGFTTMITLEQAENYAKQKFKEEHVSDRIDDKGFAYHIDTQPREYIDSGDQKKMVLGNGPIIIIKETGDVYSFSSNPGHMFGDSEARIGVNLAKSIEEFNAALRALKEKGDYSAMHPEKLSHEHPMNTENLLQNVVIGTYQIRSKLFIATDGGTISFVIEDENGESSTLYLDRRIGTQTKDEFYIDAYPGKANSKKLGSNDELVVIVEEALKESVSS